MSFFHESSFLFTLSPPFFISETCTPDRDSQSQTLISPFFHRVFPLLLSDSGLMLPPSGGESHDSRVRHGKEWREKGEEQMIDKKKTVSSFSFHRESIKSLVLHHYTFETHCSAHTRGHALISHKTSADNRKLQTYVRGQNESTVSWNPNKMLTFRLSVLAWTHM